LLGSLKINRSGVTALEWVSSKKEPESKERPEE
jgi:hypothetical protein